jgi:hypothetical protein
MLDFLDNLKEMRVSRVVLTHVIRVGNAQSAGYGKEAEYTDWLEGRAAFDWDVEHDSLAPDSDRLKSQ